MSLKNLYHSTYGNSWRWDTANTGLKPWNFSSNEDPCSNLWEGVICNSVESQVISLNLTNHNLVGVLLYNQFDNLTNSLQSLDFSRNSLFGEFPISLMNMSKLTSLDFSLNNFNESITSFSFDGLTSIRSINISFNELNGIINITRSLSDLQ